MIKDKDKIILRLQSIKDQLEYSRRYTSVIETKVREDFSISQIIECMEVEIGRLKKQATEFEEIIEDWKSNLSYQERVEWIKTFKKI